MVVWLSNGSIVVPAQACFTLALSLDESGPRGAEIELQSHDGQSV